MVGPDDATTYLDDFIVGSVREVGSRTLTAKEMIAFAREYDPQYFHIDDEAAKASIYGGLIASGWQTASIAHRMVIDDLGRSTASMGSPGLDELRWLEPVRPGDTLTLRIEILEVRPSQKKPDRGSVRMRYELLNQNRQIVMRMSAIGIFLRRP